MTRHWFLIVTILNLSLFKPTLCQKYAWKKVHHNREHENMCNIKTQNLALQPSFLNFFQKLLTLNFPASTKKGAKFIAIGFSAVQDTELMWLHLLILLWVVLFTSSSALAHWVSFWIWRESFPLNGFSVDSFLDENTMLIKHEIRREIWNEKKKIYTTSFASFIEFVSNYWRW